MNPLWFFLKENNHFSSCWGVLNASYTLAAKSFTCSIISRSCTKWLGVSLQTEWICPFTMGIILAKGRLTLDRLKTNYHSSYFLNAHTGIRHVNHKSVHTSFKNTYRNILVENQNVTSSSKNNSYSWFYGLFSGNFYTFLHFLFFFNLQFYLPYFCHKNLQCFLHLCLSSMLRG